MTNFLIIRHCQASGQQPEAELTIEGHEQVKKLAEFLAPYNIGKVISSPYTRATATIEPYAKQQNIKIELDDRLQERVLSTENLPDWFTKLQQTFEEPDLKFTGGESSREATERILQLIHELMQNEEETIAIVTHGNLTALLLNYISNEFGFEQWRQLSNPDVYLVEFEGDHLGYKRVWV